MSNCMNTGGRVAVKKGYHKMPDGTIMKDSEHNKKKKAYKHGGLHRGDGVCKKGKTRGRMV